MSIFPFASKDADRQYQNAWSFKGKLARQVGKELGITFCPGETPKIKIGEDTDMTAYSARNKRRTVLLQLFTDGGIRQITTYRKRRRKTFVVVPPPGSKDMVRRITKKIERPAPVDSVRVQPVRDQEMWKSRLQARAWRVEKLARY